LALNKGVMIGCGAILALAVLVGLVVGMWGIGVYNGLVQLDEGVKQAWAQVENVYQRRADLIPNLVKTVEGAADFERETLTEVIEARAKATSIQVTPQMLESPQAFAQFEQAQNGLSSALSRLMVVIERYPELKANQNFLQLQDELAGTENRIAVERRRFNETAQQYNARVRRIPDRFVAGFGGFTERAYFQAEPGSEEAPDVEFDFGRKK
jgi:LemA protein